MANISNMFLGPLSHLVQGNYGKQSISIHYMLFESCTNVCQEYRKVLHFVECRLITIQMLSTNSKPQIKRYNEISMVKQKKSVFIGLILLLATLIGVGVVVGSVFIAKHIRRVKIPTESLVDDNEYFGYRNAKKFLTAWSPSSNSIIAGQPAYRSLLTDPKQIQILSKFVEKHQFHSLFVYGGCVQWDSPSWVRSQIPYQESLRKFFEKFPGQKPGLMVYLNDISSNFTAYENVQYFGQALNTFNSKQLGTQKVSQVYISSGLRTRDKHYCPQRLHIY
uniref:Uncharacterized protein n=1 Tax=Spironucleus salmonicida TaxID=348837 RepID=V6M0V9_9EUKA|eukprot:EST46779.1 Hypothetical protein SS50377_13177 [Spironucleus salmonicida]